MPCHTAPAPHKALVELWTDRRLQPTPCTKETTGKAAMRLETSEYLTLSELCQWLKVKPATVYDWTHTGFIPHLKLGRLLRFERAAIAAWLADQERGGRPTKIVPLKQFRS